MDDIRVGLPSLGFSDDEIEMDFIPLMVLRNYFDVGHAQSIIPQSEQLQLLYEYLSRSEDNIRLLLKRTFEHIADGTFKLPEDDCFDFNPDDQKKFNQLINRIRPRIKNSQ